MVSCVPLLATFLVLSLTLGAAWAQQEASIAELSEESPQPSNIESWDDEKEPASTWFGMGFESRESDSAKPAQQNSGRTANNW